jgi:hypothetical protein
MSIQFCALLRFAPDDAAYCDFPVVEVPSIEDPNIPPELCIHVNKYPECNY